MISATDPLNVAGTLVPGDKVPRTPGNRVLMRDGIALAAWIGGEFRPLTELSPAESASAQTLLQLAPAHRRRSAATTAVPVPIEAASQAHS